MPDLYSALIGGSPTQADQQQALAAALRRQATLGELAQASGDRTLAPLGKELQSGAQSGAEDISSQRLKEEAAKTEQNYRAAQQRNWESQRADEMARDAADRASRETQTKMIVGGREDVAAANATSREAIQAMKDAQAAAAAAEKARGKALPPAEYKDFSALRDATDGVNSAISAYKPGFSTAGQGLKNAVSSSGIIPGALKPQAWQDSQNWWANYGRQFTLEEMHRLYGARLTENEMAQFEKYHINPGMTDEQVQQNLTQIHNFLANKLALHGTELKAGGASQDQVDAIVGPYARNADAAAAAAAQVNARPGDKYMPRPQPQMQPTQTQPNPTMLPQSLGGLGMGQQQLNSPMLPGNMYGAPF